jgi:hypothetical protein
VKINNAYILLFEAFKRLNKVASAYYPFSGCGVRGSDPQRHLIDENNALISELEGAFQDRDMELEHQSINGGNELRDAISQALTKLENGGGSHQFQSDIRLALATFDCNNG